MSLNRKCHLRVIFLAGLSLLLIGGCAKTVKQGGGATLPPVEEVTKKKSEEAIEGSEMDITDLDASIKKKEYPGIEGEFIETDLLKDCYFDFDKHDLTPDARRILAENAEILKKRFPNRKIQVEGHCDERGTKEYNLALGERRAASIKNYLVSLGIPGRNIGTISYGEEMPIDPRHNEDAWAKNRRGHIIILSD
ncbi:peptidoglycan-associated lipoprotein Pal [bacterium]|nr:peptidoglycan-associated lipoprotein Pal [bacterium]